METEANTELSQSLHKTEPKKYGRLIFDLNFQRVCLPIDGQVNALAANLSSHETEITHAVEPLRKYSFLS